MGFTTPACKKNRRLIAFIGKAKRQIRRIPARQVATKQTPVWQRVRQTLPHLLLSLSLCCAANTAWAEAFTIRSVETSLVDKVYTLSAQIEYTFSAVAIEALKNGVPLLVLIDIKVEQERNWWLNKNIAELQQGYLLLYHALTEKYIVNNLNSGAQENYDSLTAAVSALGQVDSLPILDANLASEEKHFTVFIHTYLDLEALPAPMRPIAYISSQWRLQSDWYEWPLQP